MKRILIAIVLASTILLTATAFSFQNEWNLDINTVRFLSQRTPGPLPLRVNVIKLGESHRTRDVVIKGEPPIPHIMARTAYQVVYENGFIMIDSSMNREITKTFGENDPFFEDNNKKLEQALTLAKLNIVTHEHADHISGVVSTPNFDKIAPKTMLLISQAESLLYFPHRPQIKLNEEQIKKYILFDYKKYFPLAPGIVLIKAPGHTKGSQMVYVKLQNGKEFLVIGDIAWHTLAIQKLKPKNASWVKEDDELVMAQLTALHDLNKKTQINILISHDNDQYENYKKYGISANNLEGLRTN